MKKQDWFVGGGGIVLFLLTLLFEYSGVARGMGFAESFFLIIMTLFFALYRPVWAFFLLLVLVPIETFSLLPDGFGIRFRPYQVLLVCLYLALLVRFFAQRLPLGWFRLIAADWLLLVFGVSSLVSAVLSEKPGQSLKQTIIVWSFIALYFLVRYFVRSARDSARIVPFVAFSFLGTFGFALWQSVRSLMAQASFEVMAGRPNGPFTEADWLGLFSVLMVTMVLVGIGRKVLNRPATKPALWWMVAEWSGWWLALMSTVVLLTVTVTRSAWLAGAVVVGGFAAWVVSRCIRAQESWWSGGPKLGGIMLAVVVGVMIGSALTPFLLTQRAASTGGWQSITISCTQPLIQPLPVTIEAVSDLVGYGCRFINLEDVSAERQLGNFVTMIKRPDPNVSIRSTIYAQVGDVLRAHPVFGIGWGNIGDILGRDPNGNALNASNIFLEVWLGAGALGALAFGLLWFGIGIMSGVLVGRGLFGTTEQFALSSSILFILLSWIGFTVFNLFNSGILLGFVWIWLAVAVSIAVPPNHS
jgi:hypothetical protein